MAHPRTEPTAEGEEPAGNADAPTGRKALLKIGYACNNRCMFCHAAPHRGAEGNPGDPERKIRRAARLGADTLVLSGGEPTIHPRFLELADRIADAGMHLGLITNARRLCYPRLVDRLVDRGLSYAYVSLAGPDRDLHDRHAGAPAFDQATAALGLLAERIPELTVNVVVTGWNVRRLREFAAAVEPFPSARLKFSLVEPAGNVLDDFDDRVPPLAAAARAVAAAIDHARRLRTERSVVWDGFPLCLVPRHESLECGLREDGFAFMSEAFERDWHPTDDAHRAFGEVCAACSLRRRCRGVFREYLASRGEGELRPVSRAVGNAFNWLPAGAPERLSPRACAVRAGRRPPPDPIRGIFVRVRPGWVRRHEAPTRDFSDETLRVATREEEQVYRHEGTGPLVTDFERQLRRLRSAPACRRCPMRPRCGGVFAASPESPFRRARALLARLLRRLRGSVLDVGCGTTPYRDALSPAVRSGRLRYLGLDPLAEPVPDAAGFTRVRGTLERFRLRGPPFDTVMALRSLDHLPDLGGALRRMAALTAAGGRVILAEDVVFGTVRTSPSLARILDRDDLPFEHRRNPTVDEAAAVARGAGLREIARWTPGRTESTLWVLMLDRDEDGRRDG
jgi:MoaA/NifB/PqqE/SkfB family radical SAM enzyme